MLVPFLHVLLTLETKCDFILQRCFLKNYEIFQIQRVFKEQTNKLSFRNKTLLIQLAFIYIPDSLISLPAIAPSRRSNFYPEFAINSMHFFILLLPMDTYILHVMLHTHM